MAQAHAAHDTQPSSSRPASDAWREEYLRSLPALERTSRQIPNPWPLHVLRSSQLDALRLDAELLTMLQEQFSRVFSLFKPGTVLACEPELNALLAFMVYRWSVWLGRATPGSELMNLRYRDEDTVAAAAAAGGRVAAAATARSPPTPARGSAAPPWVHGGRTGVDGPGLSTRQRVLYGVGYVLLPYLSARLSRAAVQGDWGQNPEQDPAGTRLWKLMRWVEAGYKLMVVVNLWAFTYQGKYRTLLERVLGARLVYRQPHMSRLISFEYLNRQLVWQELSEFLLFLLPLLSSPWLHQRVTTWLPALRLAGGFGREGAERGRYPVAAKGAEEWVELEPQLEGAGPLDGSGQQSGKGELYPASSSSGEASGSGPGSIPAAAGSSVGGAATGMGTAAADSSPPSLVGPCPICGVSEILTPYVAYPCRHMFCYYCLRSVCEVEQQYCCPLDGRRVEAMQRFMQKVAPGTCSQGG